MCEITDITNTDYYFPVEGGEVPPLGVNFLAFVFLERKL